MENFIEEEFGDIINLNKRFKSHAEKSNELKVFNNNLNARKSIIINQFDDLENAGFEFSEIFHLLNDKLEKISIERKKLYNEWKEANNNSDLLFRRAEKIENMKVMSGNYSFSNSERIKIEMMLVEWDIILRMQESLIAKREVAFKEEEKVIAEIERNLAEITK